VLNSWDPASIPQGSQLPSFYLPSGVAVDHHGIIYVAEEGEGRVLKLDPSRAAATPADQTTLPPAPTASRDTNTTAPDQLTDAVRADVLAAVTRANAAWVTANQSLDSSSLSGALAG
jgi:hypothetical protein